MMDNNVQRTRKTLQKWIAVHVKKFHNAGFKELAEKLNCEYTEDDEVMKKNLEAALILLYDSEDDALDALDEVCANEERKKKKKRNKASRMKKSAKRRMQAQEANLQQKCKLSEIEIQIDDCTKALNAEKAEADKCNVLLKSIQDEAHGKKSQAEELISKLKAIYSECSELEEKAIETAKNLEIHEEKVLELSEQLEALKLEQQKENSLNVTFEDQCVTETCEKVSDRYWSDNEVNAELVMLMTNPKQYPEDFRDTIGLATLEEVRTIAKVLVACHNIEAQNPNRQLVLHFAKRSNITDLLEFSGKNIKIS